MTIYGLGNVELVVGKVIYTLSFFETLKTQDVRNNEKCHGSGQNIKIFS